MASFVGKPSISVERVGPIIRFTVTYMARFSTADRAVEDGFAESMALLEDDVGASDGDPIRAEPARLFLPRAEFEEHFWISDFVDAALDTEAGAEEVYARVRLWRNVEGPAVAVIESDRIAVQL